MSEGLVHGAERGRWLPLWGGGRRWHPSIWGQEGACCALPAAHAAAAAAGRGYLDVE